MGRVCYQFDGAGLLQCETTADESPLEPSHYHLPARCTFTAPPADVPDDQWPRWNGMGWDLVTKSLCDTGPTAVEKLKQFLADNPDVADLIK